MTVMSLSFFARGLLTSAFLFCFFITCYLLIMYLYENMKQEAVFLLPLIFILAEVVRFLLTKVCVDFDKGYVLDYALSFLTNVNLHFYFILLSVSLMIMICFYRHFLRTRKYSMTNLSVKMALDSMETGICFYRRDGRMLLHNKKIDELCFSLTGHALYDGGYFYEQLAYNLANNCRLIPELEKGITVRLSDGRIFLFEREEIETLKEPVFMLTASDITELYEKTMLLKRQEYRMKELNERLTRYNREVVDVITAREILNAKVKIHDSMGENLLAMKQFITGEQTEEKKQAIIDALSRNISFLKQEGSGEETDEYVRIFSTALELDLKIFVTGMLPQEKDIKHVTAVAIHECLTNLTRHAKGNMLFVNVLDRGTYYVVKFTNNGEKPEGPISLTGGLLSLQKITSEIGGSMEVCHEPEFSLTLRLTKEEMENEL